MGLLDLEECDPLGYIPCEHQATVLRIAIAGTGVALTYSSERAPGRLERPASWTPAEAGLGGWSLDVLHHYDAVNGILLNGDGTWRSARSTSIGGGESAVTSFDGRYAFVFDAGNRHTRTVDAILGVDLVNFGYDDQGRLATVQGLRSGAPINLAVERTPDGVITGLIGAQGALTQISTDGAGHLAAITHPDGGRAGLIVDPRGLITAHIDASGGLTQFEYDDAARLVAATDADGVTVRYERTATDDEVLVRVSLPLDVEHLLRARRLATGTEKSYVAPGGPTTTLVESLDGQRAVAFPDGTSVTIGTLPDERWGSASPILTPIVEQRSDGVIRRTETERVVEQSPDNPLQPITWLQTTTINGDSYIARYDPLRRALILVDPIGRERTTVYDDRGRVIAIDVPGQPAAVFTYDGQSRLASTTHGSGASAATTAYAYADDGRVTITRPDGATEVIVVDAVGRVVQQTTGDASLLTTFDAAGRMISVRPGAAQSTTLGHSRAGRPTAIVAPALPGETSYERREYDEVGRLSVVAGPGARQISMSYDEVGRLRDLGFDRGTTSVQYDPVTGWPSAVSAPGGVVTTYRYVGGLRSAIAWSGPVSGEVAIEFDAYGRAVGEIVDSSAPVRSAYDRAGALTSVGSVSFDVDEATGLLSAADRDAARVAWQYDADGRVVSATATANGNVVLTLRYERDAFGRITRQTEASQSGTRSTGYRYDEAGRLAAVTDDDVVVEEHAYDGAGNRLAVTGPGPAIAAEYDVRNRLSRWAGVTFQYEQDGTLALRAEDAAATSYDFDDLGALRGVVLPDGDRIEYVVDWSGRRIGRRVNGVLVAGYLYRPDGQLVAEVDGTGVVVARFAYDGKGDLVSIERDGRSYLVATDHLGSPRLVIDSTNGEIAQAVEYDVWGQVTTDSNPGFQPFGFAGGLRDRDTGLIHFGARDYDPTIGRWIEADPIAFRSSDANLYAYAANDPVNRSDRSGLDVSGETCAGDQCQAGEVCLAGIGCLQGGGPPAPGPTQPSGGSETCAGDQCQAGEVCLAGIGCLQGGGPPAPEPSQPSGGSENCAGDVCGSGEVCLAGIGCLPGEPGEPGGAPPAPEPSQPGGGPPAPGPAKPGASGGGFTCIGICLPPGGGICIGYCSSGDPHIRTADGLPISFQGAGEYLMVTSEDGNVVIQARQEPPGDMTAVTITTAIAASVADDRVGVYVDDDAPLTVNGEAVTATDSLLALPNGGSVTRLGTSFVVEWPDGSRLTIDQRGGHLDYGFVPDPAIAPILTGLMGRPDGDIANDLVSRDGALVLDPEGADLFVQLHGRYGDSWRISQDESLFDYRPGEGTVTFTLPGIPDAAAVPGALDDDVRAKAEELCRAAGISREPPLSDCIVDVGFTGDSSFASSAVAVHAATAGSPPVPGVAQPVTVGETVAGALTSPAQIAAFSFQGSADQIIYLDTLGPCVDGLSWRVLTPTGAPIAGQPACVDLGRQALSIAGTYTIEVYADQAATGAYVFILRAVPPPLETTIDFGASVANEIVVVGERHRYSFNADAGQVVLLDAKGERIDGLSWLLLGPNGEHVVSGVISNDLGPWTVPVVGIYTIEIYADTTATGAYSFELRADP